MFKVSFGRLTIVEFHPLLYYILCICTQIDLPFNVMVLLGLFTDSVHQIMSETHELKGSIVAMYSMTPKIFFFFFSSQVRAVWLL